MTYKKILEVAYEMFSKDEYSGASLSQIAHEVRNNQSNNLLSF